MRWLKRSTPAAPPAWSPPAAQAVPSQALLPPQALPPPHPPPGDDPAAWPVVCEQFAQQVLLLAEHVRPAMDKLEAGEDDPERLRLLYEVDHAVTRMRRAARDLRVLGGAGAEELDGRTTSLVDVFRMAESSIERYTQVVIGKVVHLAVVAYASDDVASLVVALLDNATRYSPSTVTVSAHLLDNGAVMLRIEDAGIGMDPERVRAINALLAGPVPPIDADTGRHTGFPVVHRLARKHGIGVQLACRPSVGGADTGTIAMVVIPPALLCEIPAEPSDHGAVRPAGADDRSLAHLTMAHRAERPSHRPLEPVPSRPSGNGGELPRRESMSLRRAEGGEPPAPDAGTERDPVEAARSFAADLEAFTEGEREAREGGDPAAGTPEEDREGPEGRSAS